MKTLSTLSQRGVDFYNEQGQAFNKAVAGRDPTADVKWLLQALPRGSLVVDAGCGTGLDTAFLTQAGMRVYAYDASQEMASIASGVANQLCPQVHCHRHDELSLPEPAAAILASASLLFLEPEDLKSAMQAFSHNLAPGGVLLASFKKGVGARAQPDGRVYHDREPGDLAWLASLGGFTPVEAVEAKDVLGRQESWVTFVLRAP